MATDNGEGSSRAHQAADDSITAPETPASPVNQPTSTHDSPRQSAQHPPQPPAAAHTNSFYTPNDTSQAQPQPQVNYAQYPSAYGQPIAPYQPTQPVPQPHPYAPPERREETKGWRIYYFVLHGALLVIALIDLALSLSLLKYGFFNDPTLIAISCIGVPVLCILWSGAELITRACRAGRIGIHPGAHVGVFLIIWLAAAICGGLGATFAAYMVNDNSYASAGTCWDSYSQSYQPCADTSPYLHRGEGVFTGTVALKCFEWFLTFVLFIQACVDTHKRNVRRRPVVFVQAPYWPGPMGQGFVPMQQQQQQQQPNEKGIPMQAQPPVHRPSEAQTVEAPQQAHGGQGRPQVQEYYSPGQAA